MAASRADRAFEPHEVLLSIAFSTGVIVSFFMLLVVAGESMARVTPAAAPAPAAVPIKVKPVLDDLPLLKQGGPKKVRPKLPDMWKKNPPVQRYEASSAPSPKAAKTPEAIPTTKLAKPDAAAPPPDAEVAAKVDQVLIDAGPPDASSPVEGEGSPDGVKEGTETDPLKARAESAYFAAIRRFLNNRFVSPSAAELGLSCDEVKKLSAGSSVSVGPDRTITSASLTRPSGNAAFDARVQSTLAALVGQQLPPPPPLYPDITASSYAPSYTGRDAQCD